MHFPGTPGRDSYSGSTRVGLPDRVEAGVDYRDIRVDYTLATRLTTESTVSLRPAAPDPGDGAHEDE